MVGSLLVVVRKTLRRVRRNSGSSHVYKIFKCNCNAEPAGRKWFTINSIALWVLGPWEFPFRQLYPVWLSLVTAKWGFWLSGYHFCAGGL